MNQKAQPLEYRAWISMRRKCHGPGCNEIKKKGITICPNWRRSFYNFFHDMGPKPHENDLLLRIDPDIGYCKENCYWTSKPVHHVTTSNIIGIIWSKSLARWEVNIQIGSEIKHIGFYRKLYQAIDARKEAKQLNFM